MNNKNIAFLLPGRDLNPVGGYKIIYEYANKFIDEGYNISLIYPYIQKSYNKTNESTIKKVKQFCGFILKKHFNLLKAGEWFPLRNEIQKEFIFQFSDKYIKKFINYKIIATAVNTAYELNESKLIDIKNRFYFIQDFETWNNFTEEMVYSSYKFPLKKITISPWLQEKVNKVSEEAILVPNGFDFNYFKLLTPIEKRCSTEIAMLYHLDNRKRCCDSIAALELVKQQIPNLHVSMFGVPDKPNFIPNWISYYQKPNKDLHNKIYNKAAIYIAASEKEGFGLTVGEAMICGCAIACTNNGGFSFFVKNKTTGLLSNVYDIKALATNIIELINNDELRIKIAKNGNEYIKKFTGEKAFNLFKNAIYKL